jgi:formyl-CoA transferase
VARPLENVRVLDLSRILAGPYCTMLLGDLGADVIKVERPGLGDDTRQWGPPFAAGESAYYLSCNRNKRAITLNLKSAEGRQLAARLAENSDVLVENFLPGTLDQWGLGYETLAERNPRLVYCSISGFGQTGPRSAEPGYDIMIQALSGVMSITGEPEGAPTKLGVAISDITTGLLASQAILASLYAREKTGQGERIDLALFDSTLSWLANVGQNYLLSGSVPGRQGTAHPNIVPYQAFQASDESLIIAVGNDSQFRRFCEVIERPALAAESQFATNAARVENRSQLVSIIARLIAQRTAREWLERLDAAEIPCGAVNTIDRALADRQTVSRGLVAEVAHPTIGALKLIGSPLKLKHAGQAPMRPPPLLGQHTEEVLRERLGLSSEAIQKLRNDAII